MTFITNYQKKSFKPIQWVVNSVNGELQYRAAKISRQSSHRKIKSDFSVFIDHSNELVGAIYAKFINQLDWSVVNSFQFAQKS